MLLIFSSIRATPVHFSLAFFKCSWHFIQLGIYVNWYYVTDTYAFFFSWLEIEMNNRKCKILNLWENNVCLTWDCMYLNTKVSTYTKCWFKVSECVASVWKCLAFSEKLSEPWLISCAVAWVLSFHIPFSSSVFLLLHFLIPLHCRPFLLNYLRNFFISVEQPYTLAIRRHGPYFTHAVPFLEIAFSSKPEKVKLGSFSLSDFKFSCLKKETCHRKREWIQRCFAVGLDVGREPNVYFSC
jgi:hypothetical protein